MDDVHDVFDILKLDYDNKANLNKIKRWKYLTWKAAEYRKEKKEERER